MFIVSCDMNSNHKVKFMRSKVCAAALLKWLELSRL